MRSSANVRRERGRFGSLRFGALALTAALVASVGATVASGTSAGADTSAIEAPAGFSVNTVLSNLDAGPGGNPTSFAYAPDGRIFVARKTGVLNVWDHGVQHTYIDLRNEVNSYQSRGLVGLALDPNFATNGRLYLLFTQELDTANPDSPEPAGGQLISLTNLPGQPDVANPASRVTLMTGFNSTATEHSVAGLRFETDGSLLVGLGDGNGNGVNDGTAILAQNLDQLNGKILRIDPTTGNGVPSNPFYSAGTPGSVRSRVFAWGFRNPFRFTVDPTNGTVYVGEVGWNTWEMFQTFPLTTANPTVDRNSGWPCYEGGNGVSIVQPDYASSPITGPTCKTLYTPAQGGTGVGALAPKYAYLHKDPGGDFGSAIVGGPRYMGTSTYPSSYIGKVFIGDYARSRMQTVDLNTGVATDFGTPGTWNSPVDIQIAPDGNVVFLAFQTSELDEIVANGSDNPPIAKANADHTSTTESTLTVNFTKKGSKDPDGDPITFSWNFGDGSPTTTVANPTHTYTAAGVYQAVLTVKDSHGATATSALKIIVGVKPPVIVFKQPLGNARFVIGDTIPISIKATDPQDGLLAGDSLSTNIVYWTGGHQFPVNTFNGPTSSFQAADDGFVTAFYRITTTATDSLGLQTVASRDVNAINTRVSISSKPAGAPLTIDGVAQVAPYAFSTVIGSTREAVAPASFTKNGKTYVFQSWTVGTGAPSTDDFATYVVPSTPLKVVAKFVVQKP